MASAYSRVRLVGNCILGTLLSLPVALILSRLTVRKEGFFVFLLPLAIVFTMIAERVSIRARKREADAHRQESKKRYEEGKPPIGVG